jgi:3-keto-disaccharide hydrolase
MLRRLIPVFALLLGVFGLALAEEPKVKTITDPALAGPDFLIQGEYEGRIGKDGVAGLQVIALGDGKFDAVLFPNGLPGTTGESTRIALKGESKETGATLTGAECSGEIKDRTFTGTVGNSELKLKRIDRQSPTMGAKPPERGIVLFDGSSTDEWVNGRIQEGSLLGVGTRTKRAFTSYTLHVEFRSPYMPYDRGQARGNSGLYCNDQYEFQILDSFGLSGENNECGGYYSMAKPLVNMCLPPLSWQTYDIDFAMAQFDADGKKTKPAVATVKLNGVIVHDKYEIPRFNGGGGLADESKPGPIFVQDHGNPVHFRNIWILEK